MVYCQPRALEIVGSSPIVPTSINGILPQRFNAAFQ